MQTTTYHTGNVAYVLDVDAKSFARNGAMVSPGGTVCCTGVVQKHYGGRIVVPAGKRLLIPDSSWDSRGDNVNVHGPCIAERTAPGTPESLATWEVET